MLNWKTLVPQMSQVGANCKCVSYHSIGAALIMHTAVLVTWKSAQISNFLLDFKIRFFFGWQVIWARFWKKVLIFFLDSNFLFLWFELSLMMHHNGASCVQRADENWAIKVGGAGGKTQMMKKFLTALQYYLQCRRHVILLLLHTSTFMLCPPS